MFCLNSACIIGFYYLGISFPPVLQAGDSEIRTHLRILSAVKVVQWNNITVKRHIWPCYIQVQLYICSVRQ